MAVGDELPDPRQLLRDYKNYERADWMTDDEVRRAWRKEFGGITPRDMEACVQRWNIPFEYFLANKTSRAQGAHLAALAEELGLPP